MATSSPKAAKTTAKTATPKAPAAAQKTPAAKPARKAGAAAKPAEPVATPALADAMAVPAAKKVPKAAAKKAAATPATAKKAAAKKAGRAAAMAGAVAEAMAAPAAEPTAAPAPAKPARKARATSAGPTAAALTEGAGTAAAESPAATAPTPAPKSAGKTARKTAGKPVAKSAGNTAGKAAPQAAAEHAPASGPAVEVAAPAAVAAAPKAPPRTAAKRPTRPTKTGTKPQTAAKATAVEPPAPQPQPATEAVAAQADAAEAHEAATATVAAAADAPAAEATAPAEPPQDGARTGGRGRGERGGRGRREGRGGRDNRDAAGGGSAGGSAGGSEGGGAGVGAAGSAAVGAAERDKPAGDPQGGARRDSRPAAGNRPRRPEPMSLDERAARSKQAMALAEAEAEAETANPTPALADAEPSTGSAAATTVYSLPADPEPAPPESLPGALSDTRGAPDAHDAPNAPDAPDAAETPAAPAQPLRPARPRPSPTGPAHSALVVVETADQRHIAWQPGHTCPEALDDALHDRLDASGHLPPDDDGALPLLLRLAKDAGHSVQIDPALWPLLGANRDARTRLHVLEAAYPDGAASAGLATLLRAPLPAYQADGALFAVVAGRLLMADERGLGKGVQAMAAAELWRRHFGVQRVLVLSTADQRLAWQRAWWRFAGRSAQVVEGNANARQALWAQDADLRILSPDVLASDASALANWSPELVIVDEPQRLDGGWRHLDTPLALVLCGAALDTQPELLDALVAWLDDQRQGPLAAVRRIRAAHDSGEVLGEEAIEQISDTLSRVMLQRQRAEVAEQLPPRVLAVRQVALAAPQREAHAAHLATVQRLVAGWRRSGYLSDSDQWRLGQALAAAQTACQRANPADAHSPLAEATVAALDAQLADWGDTGYPMVAVLCASPADRDQLAAHFGESPGLVLCLPGEPLPEGTEVVLRVGVPWRLKSGPRTLDAVPGMPWVHLVGQGSIELGLADTLAQRADVPAGLAEAGGRGYLSGAKLDAWLQAIDAALAALAPPVVAVSGA